VALQCGNQACCTAAVLQLCMCMQVMYARGCGSILSCFVIWDIIDAWFLE
jgi:hypothetical protein